MKKLILSFVALLAVGTMAKATDGIVEGVYPASMTPETNSELCTQWDFTTVTFNATGDVFPIYDDCQTNVYFTMTEVAKGGIDYETFLFEISASDGTYFTGCGQNNAWNCCAGLPAVTKEWDGDTEFPFPHVGDYVLSVAKMDANILKIFVLCPAATGTNFIWTADYTANGGNSVATVFHMGGENSTYTINKVEFTEVTIEDASASQKVESELVIDAVDADGASRCQFSSSANEETWAEIQNLENIEFSLTVDFTNWTGNADDANDPGFQFGMWSSATGWISTTLEDYGEASEEGIETASLKDAEGGGIVYTVTFSELIEELEANSEFDEATIKSGFGEEGANAQFFAYDGAVITTAKTSVASNSTAIEDIKADVEVVEVARYNLAGQKIAGEQKGINIIKYSDGSSKKVLVK